jgi:glutamyl/glutaminyl-tRNA synthetase
MSIFSRIAPTPSGYLHIGNLYSFYITLLLTRNLDGKLHLRIDDLDKERARQEFIEDILESLHFMDINYDSGPSNCMEFYNSYSQQLRLASYNALIVDLMKTGLVYACTCSRRRRPGPQPLAHSCDCRKDNIDVDTPYVSWRIYVPPNTTITIEDQLTGKQQVYLDVVLGDFVIKRKDGLPSYQVASLSDDLFYGINLIIRGEDLLASTAAQLYLATLTKNNAFSKTIFVHHPLIRNAEGIKLSKSTGATSIKHLRTNGVSSTGILKMFNSTPGIIAPADFVSLFNKNLLNLSS